MKADGTTVSHLSDTNGCFYFTSPSGNTQRFFLNYRVEDTSGSQTIVEPTNLSSDITTVWIDGNSSFGTELVGLNAQFGTTISNPLYFTSDNYNSPVDNSIMRATAGKTYSIINTTDMQATLSSIIVDTSKSCNIYCRIGLPMINNYSFDYVSLLLSV
jgi:hypothetical protein